MKVAETTARVTTQRRKLSICIPTFNRVKLLAESLAILSPQLTDDIYLVVWDNCSTDKTFEYISTLPIKCIVNRQNQNVGPDRNMISCITNVPSDYIWLLCDDDIPCVNTIAAVLEAMNQHFRPPAIYLTAQGSDIDVSTYSEEPVVTGWKVLDQNDFLGTIGHMFTFGSSIIVRRDRIDLDFVHCYVGSYLLPAAILLAAAATSEKSIVSEQPLLYGRGGNCGGYDAFTVFSRNILRLFRDCRKMGYRRDVLRAVYTDNLMKVMTYVIDVWPLHAKGIWNLFAYSATYPALYSTIVPAFARRAKRAVRGYIRNLVRGRTVAAH